MKHILLTLTLISTLNICFGQVTHSISIGPDLGLGANFGKSSKASIGGSIEYVAKLSDIFGIRLSAPD